jgi:hypothetical protein
MIKKLLSKLYILAFMALTVFFMIIIWKVTFGHLVETNYLRKRVEEITKNVEMEQQKKKETTGASFRESILEGEERVKHYLGYKVLEELRIKDHFHHIGFDFKPDKRSYCIKCHGDMPHSKIKEIRAFANMHASYIACQTCHVKLEGSQKTGVFKWYDRTTGEIVPSPVKEGASPGSYESKIIPFVRVNGKLQRIDTQEQIAFVNDYSEMEKTLTDIQKAKAKQIIHKIVSPKPYLCEDCHQKEAPILPYDELGYKQKRIDAFESTEVVGMIRNYTKFFIPKLLHPGVGDSEAESVQQK